jgi:hypothetical protein
MFASGLFFHSGSEDPSFFISTWKTDNAGTTGNNQIKLPLSATGTYNFIVNWGDDTHNTITTWNQAETTHTYPSPGTYVVKIKGTCTGFHFQEAGGQDPLKITNISQWGILKLGNTGSYFQACLNLTFSTEDTLDLTGTSNLSNAFKNTGFSTLGGINTWNTGLVTNMSGMFMDSLFNDNISSWNTANVLDMSSMFHNAPDFNQNIGSWNTFNVRDFNSMFMRASSFNQNINSWDVSSSLDFSNMFSDATFFNMSFNQPLDNWVTTDGENFESMFEGNLVFNSAVGQLVRSSALNTSKMFKDCGDFNQPVINFDMLFVTNASEMFHTATDFNQSCAWPNVESISNFTNFLTGTSFSRANYDALLIEYDSQILASGVVFDTNAQYSAGAAATARANIISTYSWTINDGGQAS